VQDVTPIVDVFVPYVFPAALIFTRVVTLLAMVPGFSQGTLATRFRLMFSLMLALVLDLSMGLIVIPFPDSAVDISICVIREVLLGAGMGLVLRMMFAAVESAGAVCGINMGLSLNVLMDPTSGEETMTLGSLMGLCAALMFIALDGHHLIIESLHGHFAAFPIGVASYTAPTPDVMAKAGSDLCRAAFIIASPVIVVTLLLNMSLALVSRVVPSVNLFGIGLGLLTFSGLVSLAFEGDAVLLYIQNSMQELPYQMWSFSGANHGTE
jgi:flagellar biosynthetic protein FliR